MTKTSTIQFNVSGLASKLNGEFTELNSVFDLEEEFKPVYNLLDELNLDVDQMVVDKILALASRVDQ